MCPFFKRLDIFIISWLPYNEIGYNALEPSYVLGS